MKTLNHDKITRNWTSGSSEAKNLLLLFLFAIHLPHLHSKQLKCKDDTVLL